MKEILMSIRPQWCEKIFNGSKTIEVRKSRPSIPTPFKVYVYQTKIRFKVRDWQENFQSIIFTPNGGAEDGNGKVIGSFVCDKVYKIVPDGEYYSNGYDIDDDMLSETCLGRGYLKGYGLGYTLYGWHITNLKIYDKPRELSDFSKYGYKYLGGCCVNNNCKNYVYNGYYQPPECKIDGCFLKRPPQSWQYVEKLQ